MKVEEIITCYRKVLELDPEDNDAHFDLANTLKTKAHALYVDGGGGAAVAAM